MPDGEGFLIINFAFFAFFITIALVLRLLNRHKLTYCTKSLEQNVLLTGKTCVSEMTNVS